MRKNKFRGWDTKHNKMWSAEELSRDELPLDPDGRGFINVDSVSSRLSQYLTYIIPLEWTGLRDRLSKEIYEGDIIKCPVTGNKEYHGEFCYNEVVKQHGQWLASHLRSDKGKLPRGYTCGFLLNWFDFDEKLFMFAEDYEPPTKIEVVGNIHEDPCVSKEKEPG